MLARGVMIETLTSRLLAAFAAHAERPAVHAGAETLTHAELSARAQAVAAHLVAAGIGRGDRVAFWMEKSLDSLAVLLGTLLCGAAYVPIDPRAPWPRAASILADCAPAALAVDELRAGSLAAHRDELGGRMLLLRAGRAPLGPGAEPARAVPPPDLGREDPAYILYTSGSTGRPKGVVLSHRAALGFVDWSLRTFELAPEDRATSHAPFHFDLSTFDLFAVLAAGASVRLLGSLEAMLYGHLAAMLPAWGITVWYSVPSALIGLLRHGKPGPGWWPQARLVLFAGEVFPTPELVRLRGALPQARLCNLFGPTETNVCTWYEVHEPPADGTRPIPIGRVCDHLEGVIVDDPGREALPGAEGSLWIGGDNLLSAYWGDPELTAARLRPDPRPGRSGLLFDTGDRVREGPGGDLIFLGRRDHQVKVRGYRVELGEIESVMHGLPGLEGAAVVTVAAEPGGGAAGGAAGGHRLRAFFVPGSAGRPGAAELRAHLAERLPLYMVPEEIVELPRLPLTSSGKVDRVALAEWRGETPAAAETSDT